MLFASPDFRVSVMLNPQIALVAALPRNVPASEITAKPCVRLDICEGSKRSQTGVNWPKISRGRDHHLYSKGDYVALQLKRCRTVPAFGSFENPSILLSGLRVAVRFHCSVVGKARTP